MSRALGLLSGGLDSTLAAMTLKRQGIDVACIAFVTPFFGAGKAKKAAAALGIPLLVEEIGPLHLEMVKNPRYGYGRNLNPCIDCHAMMFRLAGEIMRREHYDFLFSGEVLGQRPMSQNLTALKTVAKYSGLGESILRPLSAKLLPVTPMEEAGLVDRERLLDIQGRSRKRQEALAREWGLESYPSSGGGCLLTEKSFTGKLRDLISHNPEATVADVELLKFGRQFRLTEQAKLVVGRNEEDNRALEELCHPEDIQLRAQGFSGPLGLLQGMVGPEDLEVAAAIVASYGKGREETRVPVQAINRNTQQVLEVAPADRGQVGRLIVT